MKLVGVIFKFNCTPKSPIISSTKYKQKLLNPVIIEYTTNVSCNIPSSSRTNLSCSMLKNFRTFFVVYFAKILSRPFHWVDCFLLNTNKDYN